MLLYAAFMLNPRILNKIDAYWNELFSPLLKRLKNHLLANVDSSSQSLSFNSENKFLWEVFAPSTKDVSNCLSYLLLPKTEPCIFRDLRYYAILTQWLFKGRVYSVTYSRFFSMLSSVRLRRKKNCSDIKSSSKVTLKLNQDFTLTFKALNDLVPPYLSFRPPSS